MTEVDQVVITTFATLFAAFGGVWAAFQFEVSRRKQEEVERNIGATNRGLHTIFNFWNNLTQYRKECIDPVRGREDDWFNMAATLPLDWTSRALQAGDLAFLLQTKYANVYSELLLEEQRFQIVMRLIETRSAILLDDVHTKFSEAGVRVGESLEVARIEEILGISTVHKLKNLTEAIVSHVDKNLRSLVSTHDKLRSAIKEIYPNKKVIRIEFENSKE